MSSSVMIVLSLCLVLIGSMVMDPLASVICFILSGVLASLPAFRDKGPMRYAAIIIVVASLVMVFSKAPDALTHYEAYLKSKAGMAR